MVMAADTLSFTPDRKLLSPHFESYKLSLRSDDAGSSSVLLIRPFASTSESSDALAWGWREARARAKWNHLSVGSCGWVVWMDASGQVSVWHGTSTEMLPRAVLFVPSGHLGEYPTALEVDASSSLWLLSPGDGTLVLAELLPTTARATANGVFSATPGAGPTPFKLHFAALASDGAIYAALSVMHTSTSVASNANKDAGYDIVLVCLVRRPDAQLEFVTRATLRGKDAPAYVAQIGSRWILGASGPYTAPNGPAAPVAALPTESPDLPSIYSWTQTPSSVSLAVPLPASFEVSSIAVLFTNDALQLRFLSRPQILTLVEESILDRLQDRFGASSRLWGTIDPSTSTWTWDKAASSTMGLLTLELEKTEGQEGGRWSSVFSHDHDDGVPESVDPSESAAMLERLEKYTERTDGTLAGSEFGVGGAGSLAAGERDPEIDDIDPVAGEGGADGTVFTWVEFNDEGGVQCTTPQAGLGARVIASPLPVASASASDTSLVMRSDVDGLVFAPPEDGFNWRHVATFPALAFVIASKRDARFVRHVRSSKSGKRAALVFESAPATSSGRAGRGVAGAGNLYVYHGVEPSASGSRAATTAKQEVIRIGGTGGPLMGVAGVERDDGSVDVVCLCEKELVVVKGVLSP